MSETIEEYPQQYKAAVKVEEVMVSPLPEELRQPDFHAKIQSSSKTVSDYMLELRLNGHSDLHFVLGYSLPPQPMEHVVLRLNEEYFDPFLDVLQGPASFSKVCEMTADQLFDFLVEHNGKLPTLANCCACFS